MLPVAGKITRSGLETRSSRPPASTVVAAEEGMGGESFAHRARTGTGDAAQQTKVSVRSLLVSSVSTTSLPESTRAGPPSPEVQKLV